MTDHHGRDLSLTNNTFKARKKDPDNSGNNPRSWLPVYDWKKRRSPQSSLALKAFLCYFGGTVRDGVFSVDAAWDAGWRWCCEPNQHWWYPPASLCPPSRPDLNLKEVYQSPDVIGVLARIDEPADAGAWAAHLANDEVRRAEKAERKREKDGQAGRKKKKAKK
mmetsp:Transcript_17093/g.34246  ORF Transcript_17093/g.34246 Transcript_17093/m.34246 type:complete len:164 (+) Transcript_17093:553-1044(+)